MQTYTRDLISALTSQRKSYSWSFCPLFWYFLKVLQKSTENAVRVAKDAARNGIETVDWKSKTSSPETSRFVFTKTDYTWIKRDQLDVTCFFISLFNAEHVSDVNTSILRSLRLICWIISWVVLPWFDSCWCYVVVWLGWCGIRMQGEAVLQISRKSQVPVDGCINIRNMLSIK